MTQNALVFRLFLTVLNSMMVVGGLAAVIYLALREPTIENNALLALVSLTVGSSVREWGSSNQWWFGSSKGSSDKTAIMQENPDGRPHDPPS